MKANRTILAALAASFVWLGSAAADTPTVNGQVRKIDPGAGKITLRHGPIKNLDMDFDGMTMVFAVQDPGMLRGIKAGDQVAFEADRVNGVITITKLQKVR